eukprot:TRINITY_DN16956_c0_g1_i1.p1 TRINITY_DN16956_c0_g1~~TRINITY_DN16956_c0_g1_i1.p1  ORF type:complete len:226 (-),score=49.38 TRINITY_DN16956_c0_g1_i1:101-742(-)
MRRHERRRSRSPRSHGSSWRGWEARDTRKISGALCALVRYEEHRPDGLLVNEEGRFKLSNLMEVWGTEQGLREDDIVKAVTNHMFQDEKTGALRYSIDKDEEGQITIRVHPKQQRSKGSYYGSRRSWKRDRSPPSDDEWGKGRGRYVWVKEEEDIEDLEASAKASGRVRPSRWHGGRSMPASARWATKQEAEEEPEDSSWNWGMKQEEDAVPP